MKNLTPHNITVDVNGVVHEFPATGTVARVSTSSVEAGSRFNIPVIKTVYGEVEEIGKPEDHPEGVLVSALVLGRLGPEWSGVAFAPATGPNDGAVRNDKGHIVAVTKLVTV